MENTSNLHVNERKCKSLTICKSDPVDISLNGVNKVETLTVLGVTFSSRASWSTHVDNIVRNVSRRFYVARILRPSLSSDNMKLLYFSFLRSLIEYCAPLLVGMSKSDANRLDRLQRRFHRLLCGSDCVLECLPSLSERRRELTLKFLKKVIDPNHVLNHLLPPVSSSERFILLARRTTRRSESFLLASTLLFNECLKR